MSSSLQHPSTLSKKKPKPRRSDTVETLLKQMVPIAESFVEHQREQDENSITTDVHLICSDGIIPVHAVVLQSVSPFFEKMLKAQGDYYFGYRPVIMPDWTVEEISWMVQFIYTGSVTIVRKEIDQMKQLLAYFMISIAPDDLKTEKRMTKSRYTNQSQQIHTFRKSELDPAASLSKIGAKSNDFDGAKRKCENENLPRAKRISVSKNDEILDDNIIAVIPPRKNVGPASKTKIFPPTRRLMSSSSNNSERVSSTDSSDGEIDWTEAKNSEWFLKEACRCQRCDKTYSNPAEASSCLTNTHNRLRCYLCFKVVRNTAKLFLHFSKKHKQGAREQTLLCGWCDQTVPFKSVSCHVISLHLTGMIAIRTNPARLKNKRPGIFPPKKTDGWNNEAAQVLNQCNSKSGGSNAADRNDFKMTKKDEKADDGSSDDPVQALWKSEKQTIRFRSICGKTRVFDVSLKR